MALILADFHTENFGEFALPWRDGCNTRLQEQLDVLQDIFELAWSLEENLLIFLGDWFHKWSSVSTVVYHMVTRKLYDLLGQDEHLKLIMIPGNHDMPAKRNWGVHTLAGYESHKRIRVIDEPKLLELEGHVCAFVPYHQDSSVTVAEAKALREKTNESKVWLFSHLDIVGARTGLDDRSWVSTYGAGVDDFDGFYGGFFGHYHVPQVLSNQHGSKFHYIGAPLHLSRQDAGTGERGVMRFADGLTEFYPIDSSQFVQFHADKPPDMLRERDYHFVSCDTAVASDVKAYYENIGVYHCKVLPVGSAKKTSIPIAETYHTMKDSLRDYIAQQKKAGRIIKNQALALAYGAHYLECEE